MSNGLAGVYIQHCPLLAEYRNVQLCVEQHWAHRKRVCCAIHSISRTSPESIMLTAVLCSSSHNVRLEYFKNLFINNCQVYKSEKIPFSRFDDTVWKNGQHFRHKSLHFLAEKKNYASEAKVKNRWLNFKSQLTTTFNLTQLLIV